MKHLSPGIYSLDLLKANVFIVEAKEGLALIDTAVKGSWKAISRKLEKTNYALSDIKHILITHAHIDHVGGLAELQSLTNAEVWTHTFEAPFVRGDKEVERPDKASLGFGNRLLSSLTGVFMGESQDAAPVHRELEEGNILSDIRDDLRVIHLPGHSAGQIGFYAESANLLIGGDVMMHIMPWLTRPLAPFTPDMAQAEKSIVKVADMKLKSLAVGHGAAIIDNAHAAVSKLVQKINSSA